MQRPHAHPVGLRRGVVVFGVGLLVKMTTDDLRAGVKLLDEVAAMVLLEAFGGVNRTTVRGNRETGVVCIGVGAVIHAAIALDFVG